MNSFYLSADENSCKYFSKKQINKMFQYFIHIGVSLHLDNRECTYSYAMWDLFMKNMYFPWPRFKRLVNDTSSVI